MSEELKPDNGKVKESLPEPPNPPEPPTDFKVAEIWIRNGHIQLDASNDFWADRIRAVGILTYCLDIAKTAKSPETDKPKIITGSGFGALDFVRNRIDKFKRKK